jgi:hypothetical protein
MTEFERSLIQERVRAGLRNAKLRGKTLGKATPDRQWRRDGTIARARSEFSGDYESGRSVAGHGSEMHHPTEVTNRRERN